MASAKQLNEVRVRVKELLEQDEFLRDDDRGLLFRVWRENGIHVMFDQDFKWVSPETIRRARQIVQERHPELASSLSVQERRMSNKLDFMEVIKQ